MSKKHHSYKSELLALQIELVKFQRHLIAENDRVLVIFEGRDGGGKDGMIKRVTEHLSPRETRVVALGKPTERETSEWYFQRYVPHLPSAQELVLFNRSWYNRAGVERVMKFCTKAQYKDFIETVPAFEDMLTRAGIKLFKYYLDISRLEQKKRLADRRKDPLKQWKLSPIDAKALLLYDDYTKARDDMFVATHQPVPWRVVKADDKEIARLNTIRDLLKSLDYEGKDKSLLKPDPEIVFPFTKQRLKDGSLAR